MTNGIGSRKCRSLREMGKPPENSLREDKNQNLTQRPNGVESENMHFKWTSRTRNTTLLVQSNTYYGSLAKARQLNTHFFSLSDVCCPVQFLCSRCRPISFCLSSNRAPVTTCEANDKLCLKVLTFWPRLDKSMGTAP